LGVFILEVAVALLVPMEGRCGKDRHSLSHDQLHMLIRIVVEDSGTDLTRERFNDSLLLLFESIPGLESIPTRQSKQYLDPLWSMYRSRPLNRRPASASTALRT
jgi:hypothetical protein